MLKCLNDWCKQWGLVINFEKSKIVHFRPCSKSRPDIQFQCGDDVIETVNQYKYLGVIISEHLDFNGDMGWKCPEHLQWLAVTRR